ncbi:Protein of unknown function [Bradyrhizobium erythrophlei]|jgi:hypothetical protein|nr:Protein of unknown function [Bradyrhizobium erythrophlei]
MRKPNLAIVISAIVIAIGGVTHVDAQDYPYCIQGDEFGGGAGDCSFNSYQQCQATASGRMAYCAANPALQSRGRLPKIIQPGLELSAIASCNGKGCRTSTHSRSR